MADNSILPKAQSPLVDASGKPTRAFYDFFRSLVNGFTAQLKTITDTVNVLARVVVALGGDPVTGEGIINADGKADKTTKIEGTLSIIGGGDLSHDRLLTLAGDVETPDAGTFYGVLSALDGRGWQPFSTNFEAGDTLDLADLADSGTGTALVKITRDSKGRISGTSAATTTDLTEGSNLYFTDARADARITVQKGAANGLAPLGSDAKINVAYLPAAVLGQVSYQGTWDASAGTPPTTTPDKGWYYIVTVAGSTDLDGITNWDVGDWAIYNGASWDKIDNTDAVVTVNGYTGAVTLTAADVGAATAAQGAKADSALQSVVAGTNVTVDNTDPQNPVISATGGGGGSGDVVGPASSVDGDVVLFDGITGKLIKSGGALAAEVRSVVLTGLSTATSAVIAATDTVLQAFGKLQAQITDNLLPPGYIDGLKMVWVSGTALTVTSGAAYIPGSSKVLRAASDIAKTGLSLSASSGYYVYFYDNTGTPDIDISTTPPAAPYNGTARTKTGDSSRRLLGYVNTDIGSTIINFLQTGPEINLRINAPRMLSAGVATSATSVSFAAYVPIMARVAKVRVINTATAGIIKTSASDFSFTPPTGGWASIDPGHDAFINHPCSATQAMTYAYTGTPVGGAAYIDLYGYVFER